jgi:hypothetical protein
VQLEAGHAIQHSMGHDAETNIVMILSGKALFSTASPNVMFCFISISTICSALRSYIYQAIFAICLLFMTLLSRLTGVERKENARLFSAAQAL